MSIGDTERDGNGVLWECVKDVQLYRYCEIKFFRDGTYKLYTRDDIYEGTNIEHLLNQIRHESTVAKDG